MARTLATVIRRNMVRCGKGIIKLLIRSHILLVAVLESGELGSGIEEECSRLSAVVPLELILLRCLRPRVLNPDEPWVYQEAEYRAF
jgi:hypothetical protein